MKKIVLILSALLIFAKSAHADKNDKLSAFSHRLEACSNTLETEYKNCPETWTMKCYDQLMEAHRNVQKCYKQITVDLFVTFYDISQDDAETRFDTFKNFIFKQYFFVFADTNFCKKNNCGISLYHYSENATTQQLHDYITKIIGSVSANYQ